MLDNPSKSCPWGDSIQLDGSILRDTSALKSFVIDIPRKKHLKRIVSEFEPEVYDDVDEGGFMFENYGKSVFRSKAWEPGHRTDIIHFDPVTDSKLLDSMKIRATAPESAKDMVRKLVTVYWDCFAEEGVKRPILGFQFAIDTGKHTPVCCKKPRY